ncbi:uncharacterized LOC106087125 precursor [Stomoxys calcitrans]|uniref:Putative 7.4 kDa secreted salivary gland protein n=1 Tax=Stomoxys calcitrans TaxID=35570 RepID=A5WYE9_STOCA|nr:uncharacterized LOC106087125 precursor [Stomoxys calcitrans]AAY98011.1 putative 7.4 kDa secreted salivary gland protein [Stomoxys calcitrans]
MLSTKIFFLLMAVVAMMVISAPTGEGTFLLACLLRSPFCPWYTPAPTPAPNQGGQNNGGQNNGGQNNGGQNNEGQNNGGQNNEDGQENEDGK